MVKKLVEIGDKWGRIWRVYILYACFCYFVFTFDNYSGCFIWYFGCGTFIKICMVSIARKVLKKWNHLRP